MAKSLRVLLAVVLGFVVGSVVNMALITISGSVIPPPANADVTTMDGLRASLHLFEPKHFIFPFLAHSVGTFVGALVAGLIGENRSVVAASVVGGLFLLGGIANTFMLPAPTWFVAVDLLFAYVPAAWFGLVLALRIRQGGVHGG